MINSFRRISGFLIILLSCFALVISCLKKPNASLMENMDFFEGWQMLTTNDGYSLAFYDIPVGGSGYDSYRYIPEICTTIKYYATISGTAQSQYLSLSLGFQLFAYDDNDIPRAFNLATKGLYNDASLYTIQLPLSTSVNVTDLGFSFMYTDRPNTDYISFEFLIYGPNLQIINRYSFSFKASGRLLDIITRPDMATYIDSRIDIPFYYDFMCVGSGSGSSSMDYQKGYDTGYNVAYPLGYNSGFSDGKEEGILEGSSSSLALSGLSSVIKDIILAPVTFINTVFDFNFFGIQFSGIIKGIITIIISFYGIVVFKKIFS